MLTGIGGQGVQLGAQVLARAAAREQREVLLFGSYAGTMRGGNTESTLIVADEPIASPPVVARTWAALAMHHDFWEPLRRKLRPGAVVVVNAPLFAGRLDPGAQRVFEVRGSEIAAELGNPVSASMVLVGALAGLTGLVELETLIEAMQESLPAYRRSHAECNAGALRAGFESVPSGCAPAWAGERAA